MSVMCLIDAQDEQYGEHDHDGADNDKLYVGDDDSDDESVAFTVTLKSSCRSKSSLWHRGERA